MNWTYLREHRGGISPHRPGVPSAPIQGEVVQAHPPETQEIDRARLVAGLEIASIGFDRATVFRLDLVRRRAQIT